MTSVRIIVGEALETMKGMPDKSAHLLLSSPPYYMLRDYKTGRWIGGRSDCKHHRVNTKRTAKANEIAGPSGRGKNGTDRAMMTKEVGGECSLCGAQFIDEQIGLEDTPEQFIDRLVEVFREGRRVLRDDGVCIVNIGDSYAGSWGAQGRRESSTNASRRSKLQIENHPKVARAAPTGDLKPKDLIGIPWMLAFAMRRDGWYLRQDIIWAKPNPMPESVTDRCTKAHEYVFLFSKSERYYWNAEAIAEPSVYPPGQGYESRGKDRTWGKRAEAEAGAVRAPEQTFRTISETRNKRSVWTIATEPTTVKHYAMMPSKLARDAILAGSPEGGHVVDPFGGAGTTGLVAYQLGRPATLIELGAQHARTAKERIGMFATIEGPQ